MAPLGAHKQIKKHLTKNGWKVSWTGSFAFCLWGGEDSYANILRFPFDSCKDQRKAVAVCLQRSPCVLIERHTPTECIENPELSQKLPELCKAQMKAFWECRKGFFDMSKRFRGNAPLSTGKYDQQFDNLSSGNFDPVEEYHKLKVLDSGNKD